MSFYVDSRAKLGDPEGWLMRGVTLFLQMLFNCVDTQIFEAWWELDFRL